MRTLHATPRRYTALVALALLPLLCFGVPGAFAQSGALGAYFVTVSKYQNSDVSFQGGYAAGAYDAVSFFTMIARQSGTINNQVLGLYQCLNNQGDTLGQVKTWVDSAVAHPSSDKDAIVVLIARACNLSVSGTPSNFEEIYQYSTRDDSFKTGYAAGIFDATSMFALAAGKAGIDNQRTLVVFQCLDSTGDKIVQLEQWINTALGHAAPTDPAFVGIEGACLP